MIDPEVRRLGVPCSQLAAMQGVSRFGGTPWSVSSQLRGLLYEPGEPENYLAWGHDMEPAILSWYARTQGKTLKLDHRTRKHPELPLTYTLDATVEGEPIVVDAKNVGWGHADDWKAGLPEDAYFQGLGYLICTDSQEAHFVASICGAEPVIHIVRRDPAVEKVLIRRAIKFWNRFVVGEEEMPIDGSVAASAWLAKKYPRHRKGAIRAATDEQIALLEEYETVRIVQDECAARRAELENQFKAAIGDGEGLCWGGGEYGGQFTWRTTKDRKIMDWESMAIGLRNEFVKDPDRRVELEEFYTRTKPGYRRIYFKSAGYAESKEEKAA